MRGGQVLRELFIGPKFGRTHTDTAETMVICEQTLEIFESARVAPTAVTNALSVRFRRTRLSPKARSAHHLVNVAKAGSTLTFQVSFAQISFSDWL